MEIDKDALKNFQDSGFNFVDEDGKEVDYDNLDENGTYTYRHAKTVIQDQMKAQNVVNTINNEFGEETNV